MRHEDTAEWNEKVHDTFKGSGENHDEWVDHVLLVMPTLSDIMLQTIISEGVGRYNGWSASVVEGAQAEYAHRYILK